MRLVSMVDPADFPAAVRSTFRTVGVDRVHRLGVSLATQLRDGLAAAGALVLGPAGRSPDTPIVSARFPGRTPKEIVFRLGRRGGVVSPRRDVVRFSPHLYNTEADIGRALEALAR